jgi:hypothetical protein
MMPEYFDDKGSFFPAPGSAVALCIRLISERPIGVFIFA